MNPEDDARNWVEDILSGVIDPRAGDPRQMTDEELKQHPHSTPVFMEYTQRLLDSGKATDPGGFHSGMVDEWRRLKSKSLSTPPASLQASALRYR